MFKKQFIYIYINIMIGVNEGFCGNGIIDGNELCDSGTHQDECCYPKNSGQNSCQLKPGKSCR